MTAPWWGALEAALAHPALGWLAGVAVLAGLVRGFSGFGSGLVFIPLAAMVVPPLWAILILAVVDMLGPAPALPRALREGAPREVGLLAAGMLAGLPLGLWALFLLPVEAFRWIASLLVLGLLVPLAAGWRWRGRRGMPLMLGTGGLSGFLGGATGLAGPPVVLLYMAGGDSPARMRANFLLYFVALNVVLLSWLWGLGRLAPEALALALVMAVPFLLGLVAGTALFRPGAERLYRGLAHLLIACAGLMALPIWR